MAAPQPGVWGIDLGQCALKAVRLENINGTVTATAFDYIEHPKILSQPDADPDQLTHEALEKFLSRNSLRGDLVAISIPGQSGLARFVKLPPVEEKKITEIVKFEAKQQIPFNLDEVVWDYQKIGSGVVTDGFAMETEIGLFAIKRDMVSKALQPLQEVGVEIHIIQMAPLSLCNYVSFDLLNKDAAPEEGEEEESGKKKCVVALDVGVETSNLVITDGGRIIWQRPIPIGGNRFTRALTKDLKLTFAKAEHLKRNATKSPDLRRILLALKGDLNEFVNEVQKSLTFFANSHRDASIQYMMGLGSAFRLPGLQKYLQEKLQLEVRKLQKFNRLEGDSVISAPVFTDNVLTFAVAYGLAVQGLKLARLQTNLLPQEIRTERLIRAKKPWAVAGAAALLLGAAGLALGYKLEHEAVASPLIENARTVAGEPALRDVKNQLDRCEAKRREVAGLERAVKAIIAGQDERYNWLKLNKFIDECLPRPDGLGLSATQKAKYWTGGGEEAFKKYAGSGGEADDALDELVLVNIEAFNTLFSDDLAGYFDRLKDTNKSLFGMPEKDQKTRPKPGEKGWVVELRGYTYHEKSQQFLLDTLVENLATHMARKPGSAPPDPKKPELDPITGRTSHVILYRFTLDKNPTGTKFQMIENSVLPGLVAGIVVADPRGTPGQPVAPRPTGGRRDSWRPIGSDAARFGVGGDKIINQGLPEDPSKPPPKVDPKNRQHSRTEFIVLFIWQEPTPSDALEGGPESFTPPVATPGPGTRPPTGPAKGPATPKVP